MVICIVIGQLELPTGPLINDTPYGDRTKRIQEVSPVLLFFLHFWGLGVCFGTGWHKPSSWYYRFCKFFSSLL